MTGSSRFDRVRPMAQLASVLLLVVAMTLSVQLRHKPESPPPLLHAFQREGCPRSPGYNSPSGAGPRAAAGS